MMKVMIIDDELYFKEALKLSIPWNELGFYICGEASNGEEAFAKLPALKPDIILVDINMPIMDGLAFSQLIKSKKLNIKIVILTGYSEFNYAKQAIQLGINNYLLKPIDEEELTNTLIQLKNEIDKEKKLSLEFDNLTSKVKESMPILKEKYLNELISGHINSKNYDRKNDSNSLNLSRGMQQFQVATIEMEFHKMPKWNEGEKELWKFAVKNITAELLQDSFIFDIFFDNKDRICIILSDKLIENEKIDLLAHKLDQIINNIWRYIKIPVWIGVGSVVYEVLNISNSYREALTALKNKLNVGTNKVIYYKRIQSTDLKANLFTADHRYQLLMNLRALNFEAVCSTIGQVFKAIRTNEINSELIFIICINIISVCLEFIAEMGKSFENVYAYNRINIIDEIQKVQNLDEMEIWVTEFFENAINFVKANKGTKSTKTVENVKKYIYENYSRDNLGIDEIAMKLYINYGHLCSVFKKETGITINEYMTEFRINKAKQLIDEGNHLVHDVANNVGYADANYFAKCFKKYFGITPSKYIERTS